MNFDEKRQNMIFDQLMARGIRDPKILKVFLSIPRHLFVPSAYQEESYSDRPIPIGAGQTISQPYIVALMTHHLFQQPRAKVLDIGTGSGYQTAILSKLAQQVYSMERIPSLAESAARLLTELKINNVKIRVDDGTVGWPEQAPYDGIVVTAAAPSIPEPLLDQLAESGVLVIPIGSASSQTLTVIERHQGKFQSKSVCECVFVPIIGRHGWKEGEISVNEV